MKISIGDLNQQLGRAKANGWATLTAKAEQQHGLPAGLLLAIASRETNMNDIVGDGGHGRGLFQIDDRFHGDWLVQHGAPGAGTTPTIADAADFAAAMLASNMAFGKQKGVGTAQIVKFACSAYNAGPGGALAGFQGGNSDARTAGGDYGGDVVERLATISGNGGRSLASAGAGGGVLQRGMRAPQVAKLKKQLQAWYNQRAPGAWQSVKVAPGPGFGAALDAAVRDFQTRNGLDVDGQVGPATLAAISSGSAHVPKPPPPQPKGKQQQRSLASAPGILEQGTKGPQVTRLKADLQAWFDRAAPGTWESFGVVGGPAFGPALDRAVRDFQQRTGLTVDGQVGPQTFGTLEGTGGPAKGGGKKAPVPAPAPAPPLNLPDLVLDSPKKVGATGGKVKLIQAWLVLHGFKVTVDGGYGKVTAAAVSQFQKQKGLPATGVVDNATYAKLVHPIVAALSPISPAGKSLGQLVVQVARQHLAQKPIEVGDNAGPWVRLYTGGQEGDWVYWCAAFATFCIQQAADAMRVANPIAKTLACDTMATEAGPRFLHSPAPSQRSRVTPGSFFLLPAGPGEKWKYEHTGIVTGLDPKGAGVLTIEGNTNNDGSANGYEVANRWRGWGNLDFVVIQ